MYSDGIYIDEVYSDGIYSDGVYSDGIRLNHKSGVNFSIQMNRIQN